MITWERDSSLNAKFNYAAYTRIHYLKAILYMIFLLFREKFILVALAGLVLATLLPQTPKYRPHRCVKPCPVYSALEFSLWIVTAVR